MHHHGQTAVALVHHHIDGVDGVQMIVAAVVMHAGVGSVLLIAAVVVVAVRALVAGLRLSVNSCVDLCDERALVVLVEFETAGELRSGLWTCSVQRVMLVVLLGESGVRIQYGKLGIVDRDRVVL